MFKHFQSLFFTFALFTTSFSTLANELENVVNLDTSHKKIVALNLDKKSQNKYNIGGVIKRRLTSQTLRVLCFNEEMKLQTKERIEDCTSFGIFYSRDTSDLFHKANYRLENIYSSGQLFTKEQIQQVYKNAYRHLYYKKKTGAGLILLLGIFFPPIIIPLAIFAAIEVGQVNAHNRRAHSTSAKLEKLKDNDDILKLSKKKFQLAKDALFYAGESVLNGYYR